jgi:Tfp pilus assembly protein PilF
VLANLNRIDDALAAFENAVAVKPDYAEAHNNRALILNGLMRFDDALTSFDTAIALKPDNATAHNNRGTALQDLGRLDEALASFEKAIALKPDYAQAYYNSGIVLQDLQRLDAALLSLDRAIALWPDYVQAHHNRGAVLQDQRRLDEAIAAYDKALAFMPGYAEAYANQSYCYLQKGQFEQGWRLHEWRKRLETPVGNRSFAQPLWLGGEDISNKTVFVHSEQGLGDTIQFCRYAKVLKARGASVVMSVQEPLYRLLQHMESGVQIIGDAQVPAAFDLHCPLLSLPLTLGTRLETVPSEQRYIFADTQLREAWQARLPPPTKPRIGLVWSGSSKHKNDSLRSIDLSALVPLLSPAAHWISLQNEPRPGDAVVLEELRQVVSYGDALKDFADTAAVIDLLDLVITVDTSVAHLAGAMGRPVWILLPFNSDWRWLLDRDDSPWYPSARLFRQQQFGSWASVFTSLHAALAEFVESRS